MAGQARQEKAKGGGTGKLVMTGLLLLPVVAVLLPSCIVLTVNMVPTFVAYMVDKSHEKYLAITVGLLNACGALPALAELWMQGQSYDAALARISQVSSIFSAARRRFCYKNHEVVAYMERRIWHTRWVNRNRGAFGSFLTVD